MRVATVLMGPGEATVLAVTRMGGEGVAGDPGRFCRMERADLVDWAVDIVDMVGPLLVAVRAAPLYHEGEPIGGTGISTTSR